MIPDSIKNHIERATHWVKGYRGAYRVANAVTTCPICKRPIRGRNTSECGNCGTEIGK